jgi:hypothetical protein
LWGKSADFLRIDQQQVIDMARTLSASGGFGTTKASKFDFSRQFQRVAQPNCKSRVWGCCSILAAALLRWQPGGPIGQRLTGQGWYVANRPVRRRQWIVYFAPGSYHNEDAIFIFPQMRSGLCRRHHEARVAIVPAVFADEAEDADLSGDVPLLNSGPPLPKP